MSSTYERYVGSEMGRTFLITAILALIFGYFSILLPLAPADNSAWFSFLYEDVTIPEDQRFNIWLVILESLFLSLFFFFMVVALGSYAEIQNRLPSWGEIFLAAVITFVMSYLFPQISVGEASLVGASGSGYNHFTSSMQTWVLLGTILGMILMTLYLFYSQEPEEGEL